MFYSWHFVCRVRPKGMGCIGIGSPWGGTSWRNVFILVQIQTNLAMLGKNLPKILHPKLKRKNLGYITAVFIIFSFWPKGPIILQTMRLKLWIKVVNAMWISSKYVKNNWTCLHWFWLGWGFLEDPLGLHSLFKKK